MHFLRLRSGIVGGTVAWFGSFGAGNVGGAATDDSPED
jgi:hypothetical protein